MGVQFKLNGSISTAGYYYQHIEQRTGNLGSSSYNAGVGSSAASIANNLTASDVNTSPTLAASITAWIDEPSVSKFQSIRYEGNAPNSATDIIKSVGGTALNSTAASVMTGLRFKLFSGNLYGTFSLYGVSK